MALSQTICMPGPGSGHAPSVPNHALGLSTVCTVWDTTGLNRKCLERLPLGANSGDLNTTPDSPPVRASTSDARVPYVRCGRSTCEYGLLAVKLQSGTEIRIVSTYNALTTCATYDARNRSRPDVACRPHSYTLRNRASALRVTCVDATPSPRFQKKNVADVASQKTYGEKARTAGCD
ncbi:hypothetical protein Bbelb_118420 [Branchiostoma belcheri]|nr:hypothetical protein Bbelb_118420 [Branchiostoma belcheri]